MTVLFDINVLVVVVVVVACAVVAVVVVAVPTHRLAHCFLCCL